MLDKVIELINKTTSNIEGSTLVCTHVVKDIKLINEFYNLNLLENMTISNIKLDEEITLEFSILKLQTIGFFINESSFINLHSYELPKIKIYFYKSNEYLIDSIFYQGYSSIVNLINELKNNSKHIYNDEEISNVIIVREEKSLFISLIYTVIVVNDLTQSCCEKINNFTEILKGDNMTDKKNIFLNELVEFLIEFDENSRFSAFITNFELYINKALATYNFYLRNFSYNKLKIQIDTKALEFNQKLQSVINDSQSKLIAIPTAFVLVLSNLDYQNALCFKNIISVIGLFIFSILIQLFINNQKSTLKFIDENIRYYKSTYKNHDKIEAEKAFNNVSTEKIKQTERILIIEVILWLIPILTVCILLFTASFKLLSLLILFFYSWLSFNKVLLKY